MPSNKSRYNPAEDYAYDPADLTPDIGEDLGRYQDPVEHARSYIKAHPEVRDRQEAALARRAEIRSQDTGPGSFRLGQGSPTDTTKVLDKLLKQQ